MISFITVLTSLEMALISFFHDVYTKHLIRMNRKKGQFTSKASEVSTGSNADDSGQDESTPETL